LFDYLSAKLLGQSLNPFASSDLNVQTNFKGGHRFFTDSFALLSLEEIRVKGIFGQATSVLDGPEAGLLHQKVRFSVNFYLSLTIIRIFKRTFIQPSALNSQIP
jgi:hypothetical protein